MPDDAPRPDPGAIVARFIRYLSAATESAIPTDLIPPDDPAVLEPARAAARSAAEAAGLGESLTAAKRQMAEWTLERYRREGFRAAYLSSWLDTPERRVDVVSILVDAATAYALSGLLDEDTAAALTERFEAYHEGPGFT